MNPGTNLRVSSLARLSREQNQTPRTTILHKSLALDRTSASKLIFGVALAVLAFAGHANAQQPYPGTTYGPIAKPSPNHYAPPDAQGPPQVGYTQPQYQPQYAPQVQPQPQDDQQPQQYRPQYSQPQAPPQAQPQPEVDQQPQYAQPYAPQYSAPQQPYTPQPYPDQQPSSAETQPYAQPDESQSPAPAQALSAEDLEQLLAPIALYPDSLLAQVLAASTYPAQVAVADQWLQQMRAAGYNSPDQIAAGANAQTSWDPSIKALTAFPDVLDLMNHDLEWTSNLGNAYYNQPQDVMQTVQVLRDRAEQAGNLQSTPQEEVQNDQGYVELAPTNPQIVYVPTYNPWDVYGQQIAPYPGFSFCGALGNFFGGLPIQYGLSFALGAFDRMPFGWLAWGFDWLGHSLLFDHAGYYTHSRQVADWGLPRGGPRAYYGHDGNGGMRDGQYRANGQYRPDGQYRSDGQYRPDQRQPYNQGGNYQRGGLSNNRGPGQSPAQSYVRPAMGFPEPGRLNYSNRTPQQNYGYRPQTNPNLTYPNRAPTYANPSYSTRPQNYGNQTYRNPGVNYGYTGRSNYGYNGPQNYAARPSPAYSNSYRAPQPDYSRGYSNRSYQNYGNTVARNERSGGFHFFSGGQPKSYSSERAPKYSYKAPKNFGSGHQNFGGGHMSAPKMSHSSGGGGHRR
jgi:hypothetical protein